MLAGWISVIWNVHRTEKAVCNPDVKEMTEFRQNLTRQLEKKQAQDEKNATVKAT
jgi:hypothetical protein